MADLTVSTAIDTFMQATDEAGMRTALGLGDIDDMATQSGSNTFTGDNEFQRLPKMTSEDLGVGTVLTANRAYRVSMTGNKTLTYADALVDGDNIQLYITSSGGPHTLTLPTFKRAGDDGTDLTALRDRKSVV